MRHNHGRGKLVAALRAVAALWHHDLRLHHASMALGHHASVGLLRCHHHLGLPMHRLLTVGLLDLNWLSAVCLRHGLHAVCLRHVLSAVCLLHGLSAVCLLHGRSAVDLLDWLSAVCLMHLHRLQSAVGLLHWLSAVGLHLRRLAYHLRVCALLSLHLLRVTHLLRHHLGVLLLLLHSCHFVSSS